ncbi:hypothetical protein [Pontibacter akesuensis]|uniref:Uncharacterized protein n=1 Tax=Pontibacter akesuensis TaxID=388950 RepID=A0A1I7KT77_9BACT|nr:hypothetical protein [Pontibacter akesuensis]GHA80778.1 hypothetical protein GCM10007389_39010 [Pontibacter akesuensis]SFV00615.1 hypothetical protein SAMN04487941_4078 [Pontibacter akesuensis]
MTFNEIYSRILPFWGETIDFSDGMILEAKPQKKGLSIMPQAASNFYSPTFSNRWNEAEEAVAKEDVYGKVMVWTMYQLFHRQARQLFEKGTFTLAPATINKVELETLYFKNLQEDAGEEEIGHYQRVVE